MSGGRSGRRRDDSASRLRGLLFVCFGVSAKENVGSFGDGLLNFTGLWLRGVDGAGGGEVVGRFRRSKLRSTALSSLALSGSLFSRLDVVGSVVVSIFVAPFN